MHYSRKAARGFTLVEALILLMILALVVIMAVPALKKIIAAGEPKPAGQQAAAKP